MHVLDTSLQDLRYALRQVRRAPGFTVAAMLLLALGIGANTAVFNVVYAVLLKPLDYPNPDRIVTLTSPPAGGSGMRRSLVSQLSIPDFMDWREQSTVFDAIAYYITRQQPVTGLP
jgi:hypothetical protein